MSPDITLRAGRRRVRISNPGKVLFPDDGITKEDLARYYAAVAPVMVPHLKGRPLNLWRWNRGIDEELVVQQAIPKGAPDWVRRVTVSRRRGGEVTHAVGGEAATLLWLANQNCITPHVWTARRDKLDRPDRLVFDLDPGDGVPWAEVIAAALEVRARLKAFGLESFIKTSGGKGLQVYVPLNNPGATYAQTKGFALAVAELLESSEPTLVVSRMKKELRKGKVFIDYSQNDEHKTTVCVYSLRARERPTVSTPVTWEEVRACVDSGDPGELVFDARDVLRRVAEHGDLYAPVLSIVQELPSLG